MSDPRTGVFEELARLPTFHYPNVSPDGDATALYDTAGRKDDTSSPGNGQGRTYRCLHPTV